MLTTFSSVLIVSSISELAHYSSFAVLWFLLRLGFDLHTKII